MQKQNSIKNNAIKQAEAGTLVYPMNFGVFDVFRGSSWKTWSRYRKHKGKFYHLSGAVLPAGLLDKLVLTHG